MHWVEPNAVAGLAASPAAAQTPEVRQSIRYADGADLRSWHRLGEYFNQDLRPIQPRPHL